MEVSLLIGMLFEASSSIVLWVATLVSWIFDQPDLQLNSIVIASKGYKRVGLQPGTLADLLLVKQSHPASIIETNSDKISENLYES
eukprot:1138133-Pelagomonas_calceolata.AAC.4